MVLLLMLVVEVIVKDDGICIDGGTDGGVGGEDSGVDNGKGDCSDGGVEVDKLIVDDSVLEELVVDDGTICTICTPDVVSSFSVSDSTKLFSSEAVGDLSDT